MVDRYGYVYGLVDPLADDELRYVGKTWLPLRGRLKQHVNEANRDRGLSLTHKVNWIKSLQAQESSPAIVMLDQGHFSEDDLRAREIFWITRMVELGARLTNLSYGGEGGSMAPDTVAKMSESAKLRYTDPAEREKTAAAQRGMIYSDEARQKMSESATKYFADVEARQRQSEIIKAAYQKPGRIEEWYQARWRRCVDCALEAPALAMARHTRARGHEAVRWEYTR